VPRPVFVLVDVEPDRFVPVGAKGHTVVAVPLQVDDTGGRRSALLFTADDGQVWWLVVANDVTVRLMIEYLRGTLARRCASTRRHSARSRTRARRHHSYSGYRVVHQLRRPRER